MRKVKLLREFIRAWDPVAKKMVWEHETTSGERGRVPGSRQEHWVYVADSGQVLTTIQAESHIMAAHKSLFKLAMAERAWALDRSRLQALLSNTKT